MPTAFFFPIQTKERLSERIKEIQPELWFDDTTTENYEIQVRENNIYIIAVDPAKVFPPLPQALVDLSRLCAYKSIYAAYLIASWLLSMMTTSGTLAVATSIFANFGAVYEKRKSL